VPSKVELLVEISRIRDVHKEDFVDWANKLGADVRAYWTWDEIIDEIASGRKVTKQDLEDYLAQIYKRRKLKKRELSFEEEHIKEKIVEREISRKKVSYKETIFDEVVEFISNMDFLPRPGRVYEKDYEYQLWQALNARYPNVEYEKQKRDKRFDIKVDNQLVVELKRVYGNPKNAFRDLHYQLNNYSQDYKNIIVVLVIDGRVKKDDLNSEIKQLKNLAKKFNVNLKIIKKEVIR